MSRPAPALRAIRALVALELRLLARRGENVLATMIIPVAVLLFFAVTAEQPASGPRAADFLVPGTIALAIIASGLVNLGIATAYERAHGVLKRLGGAPITRAQLVVAKFAAILCLETAQGVLIVATAIGVLHWQPGPAWSPLLLLIGIALGTAVFTGLGLLLAGTLRAEATLALANGLFLVFLMLGGIIVPVEQLPGFLQPVAAVLPATALADLLRIALDGPGAGSSALGAIATLLAWGIGAAGLAIREFRWD